jgi:molybdopterin synthase sulfur carrier subunit
VIRVRVRYFASIREALGAEESVQTHAATVGELRRVLISTSQAHARVLGLAQPLRMALDQVMCDEPAPLRDGAEVAFFPPVTGG